MLVSRSSIGAVFGLTTLVALTLEPKSAQACGGLFCNLSSPVEQTAERIVFVVNDDDTTTAIIEIQYQGPSEKFAWLLPMPGVPKVGVSAQEALDAIDQATAPQYVLEYTYDPDCAVPGPALAAGGAGGFPTDSVTLEDDAVTVLDQGNAGPYDYVTISADAGQEDAAQKAVDWLQENGYDVGAGAEVLAPYLSQGLNLVAFRLTKGQDVGSILPVQLTYEGSVPSIPIQPTAVAAQDDMGVRVFLLGEARGVSDNYLSLTLNEARINWFNWQDGYNQVVSEAADEAGGHGFVTEYAGAASKLAKMIWTDEVEQSWATLQDFSGTGAELMMTARFPFARYQAFRRAVELSVALPEGITVDEFATDPVGYEQQYGPDLVDKAVFMKALEEQIVVPLKDAQAMVDAHRYMSRLYTTLSPEEMVVDPSFVFNDTLEDVSNIHRAKAAILCDGGSSSWVVTLEDGTELQGGQSGVWFAGATALPAAASITAVGASGDPEVVVDNSAMIEDAIDEMQGTVPADSSGGGTPTSAPAEQGETSDAAAVPAEGPAAPTGSSAIDEASSTEPNDDLKPRIAPAPSDGDSCSVAAPGKGATSSGAPWLSLLALGAVASFRRRR